MVQHADIDHSSVTGAGIPETIVNAKGDIIAATAADTVARLAVGTNGHVLTADSAESTGIKWAAPSGGSIPNLFVGTLQSLWGTPTITNSFAADRAYFAKFIPTADITVDTANWECTTSAGNIDFGIYNEALSSRLGSTGSFASPGTGMRTQALTGSVAMTAGTVYYLAAVFSSTSIRVPCLSPVGTQLGSGWNLYGTQNSAGGSLPASLTPTWEAGGTGFPIFFFTT